MKPCPRCRQALVLAVALPALLVPLPGLLGGLALLAFYRPLWWSIPLAGLVFALTAIFLPRPHRLPLDAQSVSQAPRLYDVLERIGSATGTPKIERVAITTEQAIAVDRIGRRRRRVLKIGLPAWEFLGPQERVAALAQALYDDRRTPHDRIMDAADHILDRLGRYLSADYRDEVRIDTYSSSTALITPSTTEDQIQHYYVTKVLNAVFGPPVRGYRRLLTRLDRGRRLQRRYGADQQVASIAGAEAAAGALERLLFADTGFRVLERSKYFAEGNDPLELLRRTAADVPEHELLCRIEVSLRSRTRLIRETRRTPAVVLCPVESARIDEELTPAARAAIKSLHYHL